MKAVNVIIVFSCAFIVLCISLQILTLFILKIPMPWTEEYARYFFVWLTMFGSVKALRERSHIFVDIMEVLVKGRIARYSGIIADVISMMFFCILLYVSIPWTIKNFGVNTESIPDVSLGLFYSCIPIAAALMLLFNFEVLMKRLAETSAQETGE
jgi:TRAP-type C4-dicarboxylate transport system permease small subunit